jgi:uncharacterized protein
VTTHTHHWNDIRIVDAHVHFFSHSFYSTLARQKQVEKAEMLGPLLGGWEIPESNAALAGRWVKELDANQVSRACLIASTPGDEESVSAAVAQYPDRFHGYFMLDPTSGHAVERMQRAAENPHLHCVCLFPAMHRFGVNDAAQVTPILDIAAAHHMPVFVHAGALSVGVRKKLGLVCHYDMRFSNPMDLHPVALRYPQVPFILPHFGAGMLREALMVADLCPNVFLDTSSSNRWMGYEGLKLREVFGRALDVLGAGRLLFGTDSSFFPRGWQRDIFDQQATALYELGLKQQEMQQIFGGNIERLLAARWV